MNDTREHILLTALQLFLQNNFKEVTMRQIVDKSGMSKGAFYHYFESKEQVFAEVIDHFFLNLITADYAQFSQQSLKQFYNDILHKTAENIAAPASIDPNTISPNNNYYHLIFDAMRMLPGFKEKQLEQQRQQLEAWKNVVHIARRHGEIHTLMTNEQVAKLFIFLSDGLSINLVMNDSVNKANAQAELKLLWDGLYTTLKL